jgi:hypothetical protein
MPFRLLSLLAAVLALFVAPVVMAQNGAAAHGRASVEEAGHASHCGGTETPQKDERQEAMMSCAVACSMVPAAEPGLMERAQFPAAKPALVATRLLRGIALERETPPPRSNPEI